MFQIHRSNFLEIKLRCCINKKAYQNLNGTSRVFGHSTKQTNEPTIQQTNTFVNTLTSKNVLNQRTPSANIDLADSGTSKAARLEGGQHSQVFEMGFYGIFQMRVSSCLSSMLVESICNDANLFNYIACSPAAFEMYLIMFALNCTCQFLAWFLISVDRFSANWKPLCMKMKL